MGCASGKVSNPGCDKTLMSKEGKETPNKNSGETSEKQVEQPIELGTAAAAARKYIEDTHGSLPDIKFDAIKSLLADDVCLKQEERNLNWDGLKGAFNGWGSIVDGKSWITIHSVADAGDGVALAHWETNYNVKPEGQTFYGTNINISGKQMRSFTCFASFRLDGNGKIVEIIQRSDDLVRKLGIADAVYEHKKAAERA